MTKPKKKPKYNQNSAIKSALRRAFSRSPIVKEVLDGGRRESPKYKKDGTLAKKPSVEYSCECCAGWFKRKDIQVDHKDPVVDINAGFVNWDKYVERLWCDKSNLQRLCLECHDQKSAAERKLRSSPSLGVESHS